jgi:hypothetical protein
MAPTNTTEVLAESALESLSLSSDFAPEFEAGQSTWVGQPFDPELFRNLEPASNVTKEGLEELQRQNYKYTRYLPYGPPEGWKMPPLVEFDYINVGLQADPALPNLLNSGATFTEITSPLGTEIRGIHISQFTDAQKNELALLATQRGALIFRDQDLVDQPSKKLVELGEYLDRCICTIMAVMLRITWGSWQCIEMGLRA